MNDLMEVYTLLQEKGYLIDRVDNQEQLSSRRYTAEGIMEESKLHIDDDDDPDKYTQDHYVDVRIPVSENEDTAHGRLCIEYTRTWFRDLFKILYLEGEYNGGYYFQHLKDAEEIPKAKDVSSTLVVQCEFLKTSGLGEFEEYLEANFLYACLRQVRLAGYLEGQQTETAKFATDILNELQRNINNERRYIYIQVARNLLLGGEKATFSFQFRYANKMLLADRIIVEQNGHTCVLMHSLNGLASEKEAREKMEETVNSKQNELLQRASQMFKNTKHENQHIKLSPKKP